MKSLPILITVLALTCLAHGQGSVVYCPFRFTRPRDWRPWDVNQDGVVDFTLTESWIITRDAPTSGMLYSIGIRPTADSHVLGVGSYAVALSAGAEISLSPLGPDGWQQSQYGSLPRWVLERQSLGWDLVGIEGADGERSGGILGVAIFGIRWIPFGWLRVSRGEMGTLSQIVPVDFAWETQPEMPIIAGIVPELSAVALSILGLGWFGVIRS